jgi:hypothetical protein
LNVANRSITAERNKKGQKPMNDALLQKGNPRFGKVLTEN